MVNDIKKWIEKSRSTPAEVPHIALARLVNNRDRKLVYYLPYIFASATTQDTIVNKLNKLKIFTSKLYSEEFYDYLLAFMPATSIGKNCGSQYAHSERAIFEKLLELNECLANNDSKEIKYILQVKNALPMYHHCQDLWLNKNYKNKKGEYVGKNSVERADDSDYLGDSEESDKGDGSSTENVRRIYVWNDVLYLQRIEVYANIEDNLYHSVNIDYITDSKVKRKIDHITDSKVKEEKGVEDKRKKKKSKKSE